METPGLLKMNIYPPQLHRFAMRVEINGMAINHLAGTKRYLEALEQEIKDVYKYKLSSQRNYLLPLSTKITRRKYLSVFDRCFLQRSSLEKRMSSPLPIDYTNCPALTSSASAYLHLFRTNGFRNIGIRTRNNVLSISRVRGPGCTKALGLSKRTSSHR